MSDSIGLNVGTDPRFQLPSHLSERGERDGRAVDATGGRAGTARVLHERLQSGLRHGVVCLSRRPVVRFRGNSPGRGVSRSQPFIHRKFIDCLDLEFLLYSDSDLAITEAYRVKYRLFKLLPRSRRSCFLIDRGGRIRYKWVADHPLDATRDTPSMEGIHTVIDEMLGDPDADGPD